MSNVTTLETNPPRDPLQEVAKRLVGLHEVLNLAYEHAHQTNDDGLIFLLGMLAREADEVREIAEGGAA